MKTKHTRAVTWARGGLGIGILILLAGCAGTPYWGPWSQHPTGAQYAAGRAREQPAQPPRLPSYATYQR